MYLLKNHSYKKIPVIQSMLHTLIENTDTLQDNSCKCMRLKIATVKQYSQI